MAPHLPDWKPFAPWQPAPADFVPARYDSVFPPVRKLSDATLAVDQARKADGSFEIRIFSNADHANLHALPANAPRKVKALYRRGWQLRFLRMTDDSPVRDILDAESAWAKFVENSLRAGALRTDLDRPS